MERMKRGTLLAVGGIAAVLAVVLVLTGCAGGEKGKLQGAWQSDNEHIIFSGDTFIMLSEGTEDSRGKFETFYKTNKENTFLRLTTQYETIWSSQTTDNADFLPIAVEVKQEPEEISYKLTKEKTLVLNDRYKYTKATIPGSEMKTINQTFEINRKNPDLRDTDTYNGQVYTTAFRLEDIHQFIQQGDFENKFGDKEKSLGIYKDGVLFLRLVEHLDTEGVKGNRNFILKSGSDVYFFDIERLGFGRQRQEPKENWIKAVYTGKDIPFYNIITNNIYLNGDYSSFNSYCKMSFSNRQPVIEVVAITDVE